LTIGTASASGPSNVTADQAERDSSRGKCNPAGPVNKTIAK
jgi:hypothetical protein